MATKRSVLQAVYTDLIDVMKAETNVSPANEYVDPLNSHGEERYPFIGFEVTGAEVGNDGIGAAERLSKSEYDADGNITSRTYSREITLYIDLAVFVDDYNYELRDDLYVALDDHFSAYEGTRKSPSDLADGVTSVHPDGFDDAFTDIVGVKGDRLTLAVSYKRAIEYTDVPVAETVTFDITSEGTETPYPDTTVE